MSTNRLSGRARPILLQSPASIRGEPEYITGTYDTREIRIIYVDQEAQKQREQKQADDAVHLVLLIVGAVLFAVLYLIGA